MSGGARKVHSGWCQPVKDIICYAVGTDGFDQEWLDKTSRVEPTKRTGRDPRIVQGVFKTEELPFLFLLLKRWCLKQNKASCICGAG